MRELPGETVTFLFTDIEGSTRLLHDLGPQGYAEALAEHRRIVRAAVEEHGGAEVDTQGDAFFCAFARATDALNAAAQAQAELLEGPIRMRIGLHTGEPLLHEGGYVGVDVHRAARIAAAGHGGQTLVSATTHALARQSHPLRDLGPHRLKDLAAPERLYQLGEGEFPPLKTLHQTNLPIQPTPLIGRERELAEVGELLARSRLVTITGTGGSGKTRLALQVAAEAAERFVDGTFFVPLASVAEPTGVSAAIASALGVGETPGASLDDVVVARLAAARILLILDNFEHVVAAAPLVARILASAPQTSILVTSRERLALAGEHEFVTPSMAVRDAVALFEARAHELGQDVHGDPSVMELCRRLDGLPLAIELAASRVKVVQPREMLALLDRRFELLATRQRDLPDRQRTLRATIDWSFDMLERAEQQTLCSIAIFAGSFSAPAAQAVANASLHMIEALVDKSLVRTTGDGRFFLLETIRDYALAQSTDDPKGLALRFVEWVVQEVEAGGSAWHGANLSEWLLRYERELPNIRHGVRVAHELGEHVRALRIASAPGWFWQVRGFYTEALDLLEHALAQVELTAPARPAYARALVAVGVLAWEQRDLTRAEASLRRALELDDALDTPTAAYCRNMLSWAYLDQGNPDAAEVLQMRLVDDARMAADDVLLSTALQGLAAGASLRGDYVAAIQHSREALAASRRGGNESHVSVSLRTLAEATADAGDLAAARTLAEEAVEATPEGDLRDLASALNALGSIALLQGDVRAAAKPYATLLGLYEPPLPPTASYWLLGVAAVLAELGHEDGAVDVRNIADALNATERSPWRPAPWERTLRERLPAGVDPPRPVPESEAATLLRARDLLLRAR